MPADAQVARWQSKYGRDPKDQQRSWLVNKITNRDGQLESIVLLVVAMIGTKLIAQITIKNLQNMHARSLPPTGARGRMELEYQD